MSYIKNRIAKNLTEDEAYRAAYEEEVELQAQVKKRRKAVMNRITAIRKAHHVTQEQLAQRMRISQERVSQIERGVETISVDRFLDMATALGLHMLIVEADDVSRHGLEQMVVS